MPWNSVRPWNSELTWHNAENEMVKCQLANATQLILISALKESTESKRGFASNLKLSLTSILLLPQADEKPEKPEENKEKEEAAAK
jgi:hypothetical protein